MTKKIKAYSGYCLILLLGFFVSCVPEETEFISPIPLATAPSNLNYTSFTATWETSLGVDAYILEVAEDIEFNRILPGFPTQVNQAITKDVTGLKDGIAYFYRLRGIFNGANTAYSNIISTQTLSFSNSQPTSVRLVRNGVTNFLVKWDTVGDAEGYIINLALDANFTNPISNYFQLNVGLADSILLENLLPEETYYFRVKSYRANSSGLGQIFSDESQTLINSTLLPTPPEVLPASDISPLMFTAHWKSVPNADFYILDVARDPLFTDLLTGFNQKQVLDTFSVFNNLNYTDNHYYRVKVRVKGKDSEYSETQEVLSSVKLACKIEKIHFNTINPTLLTYDGMQRLVTLDAISRYGSRKIYSFEYESNTSKLIKTAYGTNASNTPTDTLHFFYNTNETLDSIYVQNISNSLALKYTYDSQGFLLNFSGTLNFPGDPTNYFFLEHDYTTDEEGNVLTLVGREYYFSINAYRDLDWEFRYDDKINPLALLPQSIARIMPFTLNYDGDTESIPFFSTRNIVYADFGPSTEIIAYDYNTNELVENQLGFFSILYEYKDCD